MKTPRPTTTRGKYHGMFQVFAFNWPQYAGALAVITVVLLLARVAWTPAWLNLLLLCGAGGVLFWTVTSLLVSHHVYDRSNLYRWEWIGERFPEPPKDIGNIHAGLDESSEQLQRIFPHARLAVWDIHKPEAMPERSIARARRQSHLTHSTLGQGVDFAALPAVEGCFDAVFVLFAAHELRAAQERERFFCELHRVVKPAGTLLIVEHLRDWKNFVAYGPGCLHFLLRSEWLRLARRAGFSIEAEFSITPFVRIFHLQKL